MTPLMRRILFTNHAATYGPPPAPGAAHVNSSFTELGDPSGGNVPFPSGAAVGDVCAITVINFSGATGQSLVTPGSSQTLTSQGSNNASAWGARIEYYSVVLGTGDPAGGIDFSSGGYGNYFLLSLWRGGGVTLATKKTFAENNPGASPLQIGGFAPSVAPASKGVFAQILTGGGSPVNHVITGPTSWTSRWGNVAVSGFGPEVWDRLTGYSSASLNWTGFGTGNTTNFGSKWELT